MAVRDVPVAEVSEESASPPVKAIYDDIKATMRVPVVDLLFRTLASNPDVLTLAWRLLKPNAQTVFFEQQADRVRERAVDLVSGHTGPGAAPGADAENAIRVFHYLDPKILIAAAALRAAVNGQVPRLEELPRDRKRQVATGIPAGAVSPAKDEPASADLSVSALFDRLTSTLGGSSIRSEYRALFPWPQYLESCLTAWARMRETETFAGTERTLRRLADETVLMLPFRMDMNPHVLRLCGCSEADIDLLRATLDDFYRLAPGVVANLALVAIGAFGRQAAAESPFPARLAATT